MPSVITYNLYVFCCILYCKKLIFFIPTNLVKYYNLLYTK